MSDTRRQLDELQLSEARARANGAIFRRVLGLIVGAIIVLSLGSQRPADMPLAALAAVVLVVAAIVIAWRGDRFRR